MIHFIVVPSYDAPWRERLPTPTRRSSSAGPRAAPACPWALGSEALRRYHDEEWGVPLREDRALFEFLVLEGAQAGLSWSTILGKRDRYRAAFARFEPARVARFTARDLSRLLRDPGIVRNRAKIEAAIANARATLAVQRDAGSFGGYLWRFVDGRPIDRRRRSLAEVPTTTVESEALSTDLRARGFAFVGPTICYAFMQAVGMVNDHLVSCPRYAAVKRLAGFGD